MPEQPQSKLRLVPAPPDDFVCDARDDSYVELDVATNFSFLRGASHADELVLQAARLGYGAIGVADLNSVAGIVRAYVPAKKLGLKLIVGAHLTLTDAPDLLVWARDRASYATLCRLLTLGKRRTGKGECLLTLADVLEHGRDLLAALIPPVDLVREDVSEPLRLLKDAFGRSLSIAACCDVGTADPKTRIGHLIDLSRSVGVPLLATNHVHYHDASRRMLQDVLTCVRHGCAIQSAGYKLFPNGERYLKSPEQMRRLWRDHPQALQRTVEIARQCTFTLDELRYEYPDEIVPPGTTPIEHLTRLAWNGAAERYPAGIPEHVRGLIERELVLIAQLKYEAYFLTVYDLVRFARERGILCQGRGSAANSTVCYCIGVTSVDPAKIDVLFERFVSAARNEPPDIDVDFEHERREEVIQYVYDKYGRDRAGMTAEVITYRGRSAIRDVGKALGFSLDQVDTMAKQLDWWHSGTVAPEQIRAIGLDPADPKIRQLIELTGQLLGFPRHLSQHVGGMVMTRGPLCELVPIENASMVDRTVIEWDKDDIDALGMLKVDILALGMLTCISKTLALVNAGGAKWEAASGGGADATASHTDVILSGAKDLPSRPLEMHTIPSEDPRVYEMIQDADTLGVFQIESRAQMTMLPRLKPREFYDLVIEVAIVRPGPIQGQMVHPYLKRRDGVEPIEYPSDALKAVLGKTLGVPLFQEQAMKVVMVAADFTADEANQYRRAMAAWRQGGEVERFERRIVAGMLKNGYTPDFAERLCLQLRGFGSYGFPESHAASFALLVYVSCWLKRYHPAAFATGLLNSQPMGFYAPAQIIRDAREHGVEVCEIDVNASEWDCTLVEDGERLAVDPSARPQAADACEVERETWDRALVVDAQAAARGSARNVDTAGHAEPHSDGARERSGDGPLSPALSPGTGAREPEAAPPSTVMPQTDSVARPHDSPAITHAARSTNARSHVSRRPPIPLNPPKHLWGRHGPSLQLGLRLIKGLRCDEAQRLVESRRRDGPFTSIENLQKRTRLSAATIDRLAAADAFGSLERTRRLATWEALALDNAAPGLFDDLAPAPPDDVSTAALPAMSLGQEVLADYATTTFSLKAHPLSLMRPDLQKRGIITSAQLARRSKGWVKVAGIVLIRQRPGTASGIVFATLEDETGVVNLIIRPQIFDRYLAAARHARILQADGLVERNGKVIHVMALRLHDISGQLTNADLFRSRDFH